MEAFLAEKVILKQDGLVADMTATAITGNRVDISQFERVSFIVQLGAGTTTTAHSLLLKQSDAASAGTTKALAVTNPYYHKVGAATKFTKVEFADGASALDTYDLHALLSNSASIVVLEVLKEDLDVANGFRWVSLNMALTGGAQTCAILAVGHQGQKPAYEVVV